MKKIQFSSLIDGVHKKKDRTLSIKLGTQELSPTDTAEIFDLMGKQIWIAMAETPVEEMDIPEVVPEMKGDKTPSQRLRGIIFKLWETKSGQKQPFPSFYEDYMFKLCEHLKDKLE